MRAVTTCRTHAEVDSPASVARCWMSSLALWETRITRVVVAGVVTGVVMPGLQNKKGAGGVAPLFMYVSRMGVIIQGDCYTYSVGVSIDVAESGGGSLVNIGFPFLSVLIMTYSAGIDWSRLIASWRSWRESFSLIARTPHESSPTQAPSRSPHKYPATW
jgi:hypothetical protein